jgi:hypothetical protein
MKYLDGICLIAYRLKPDTLPDEKNHSIAF